MVLTRDGGIVSHAMPIITALFVLASTNRSESLDRPFITTHSGRWRFAQVIMISVFGQWSGNGLGYFNATIFKVIGYEKSSMQLLLNLINSLVSAVGALTAVCLTDKMRRRPVLIYGTFGGFDLSRPSILPPARLTNP
jgi:hypothetical protein